MLQGFSKLYRAGFDDDELLVIIRHFARRLDISEERAMLLIRYNENCYTAADEDGYRELRSINSKYLKLLFSLPKKTQEEWEKLDIPQEIELAFKEENKKRSDESQAFDRGYRAFQRAEGSFTCPYTDERLKQLWKSGHDRARYRFESRPKLQNKRGQHGG